MLKICKKLIVKQSKHNGQLKIARFFAIKKVFLGIMLGILVAFPFFSDVLAQAPDVGIEYAENIALDGDGLDVRIVLAKIVQIALGFLSIVAVVYVMYAGWLWMTSEGNADQIDKAKKTLVNAIIGLVIMLSAFMIVTWIISMMSMGGSNPGADPVPSRPNYSGGIGVLGACSIENVYPEPKQTEVPRNVSIIVTFKEEVDPTTICDDANGNSDGVCDFGEYIIPENVRLYRQAVGDGCDIATCASNVVGINVFTNDNKTFVFVPVDYIGSPSEYLWYEVYLSNDIRKKANGAGVFDNCRTDYMSWDFHVSDKIDLTPPQVLSGGVYPAPDDTADIYSPSTSVAASGVITLSTNPKAEKDALLSGGATADGSSKAIVNTSILIDPDCNQSGNLKVSVLTDGQTAQLSNGSTLLGSAVFSDKSVDFPGFLSFTVSDFVEAGFSWTFSGVEAKVVSDLLSIGGINYVFVSSTTSSNQVVVGADLSSTISNIVSASAGNPDATVVAGAGNTIAITAKVAGTAGDSIALTTTSAGISLSPTLGHLSGGSDNEIVVTVQDRADKPRNSIIQINFNEAIMPITVSGNADDVSSYIRVLNNATASLASSSACTIDADCKSFDCSAGTCMNDYLAGEFILSNIYRTVEFVSDNLCGVNGCGEEIYCLPSNSNLRIDIVAANLDACTNCSTRSPFSICNTGHCYDTDTSTFFPRSLLPPMDGVMDAALNSLDGNRGGSSIGPSATDSLFYNENITSGSGDSYLWSFIINDQLDMTAPLVKSILPVKNGTAILVDESIVIGFDKVMMSSSARTGQREIASGEDVVVHHNLNAWSAGGAGFGYWTECNGIDDGPVDGEYDWSEVQIRHSDFPSVTSFRSQVGSGLKDINQNCYKPSGHKTNCSAGEVNPSCCDDSPTAILDSKGNCQ